MKTLDFSTLYNTIPHNKLKSRLASIVNQAFCFNIGKKPHGHCARPSTLCDDFVSRSCLLTSQLMKQGYERFK